MELLYSQQAIAATISTTVPTCINTAATILPFQLPAFQNIWSPSSMVGKGFMFLFGGGYNDLAALETVKLQMLFDVASGASAATSVVVAAHGLSDVPTTNVGLWQAQCWMTCVSASGTASTWYVNGNAVWGVGNTEAVLAGTAASSSLMWGGPSVTTGVPAVVTLSSVTPYYPDLWSTWLGTGASTICTTTMMVFGLN